jgi:predicted amidophosphoribosyltransferase
LIDLTKLDRPPAGFAACATCAYAEGGSPAICFTCASEHTEPPAAASCRVCGQALPAAGQSCGNPVCNWDDREFERVWPISMRTGQMEWAINTYKFDGYRGWAAIFGRILVGFLDEHADVFERFDLIIPSPTYTGTGGRPFDHTRGIVEAAQIEEPIRWPFAFDVIVKDTATRPFTELNWRGRKEEAEQRLRLALRVPDPSLVRGKRILVVDDVFTEGFTIREVAFALNVHGATEVSEVVLARQPWRS